MVPAASWQATVRALMCALALTCAVGSTGALAESDSTLAPDSSGASTRCTDGAASGTASPDVAQFRCLTPREQATSLRTWIEDQSLLSLTDDQILSLMDAMKAEAFVEYAKSDMIPSDSYEFSMFRQERVYGKWAGRPDHMVIRYQDTPRRVYAKWLDDGAHAGQEVLYDETADPTSIFGHLGGPLRVVSGKVAIDGPFAHAQSRHSIRDLGLQFIARTVEHDARSFREEGLTEKPARIELMKVHGARFLAWTWIAPSGPPAHYAQRVRLLFDLRHTWPSGEAAWDERGDLLELIRFEDVAPEHWSGAIFDPRNPEYGFR
jgi:hypothetical protein